MAEHYFSRNIDNNRTLYLAPLTDRDLEMSGQEIADTSGYFLFESQKSNAFERVEIIARVADEEAIFRLRQMLDLA
jgi:hypothetical protein